MKHVKRMTVLFLFALFVFPLFFSCQALPEEEDTNSVTWNLVTSGAGWYSGEKWVITDDSVTYSTCYVDGGAYTVAYSGTIVKSVTDSFNGGDSVMISGGVSPIGASGYYVFRYTSAENAGWGTVGKYNVFRWQANAADSSKSDFTVGTNTTGVYPNLTNQVFDTADLAESGATNAANYFTYASSGAERN